MTDDASFEPVTWLEARDHLVRRLMMDQEWVAEAENQLTWWPTPLPMTIEVIESGVYPGSSDNWLRIRASTPIGSMEEVLGRELASEHAASFPVGAIVFRDGELSLQTTLLMNPRNRSLLSLFHNSLLIQAAESLRIAIELNGLDDVGVNPSPHPVSGVRDGVDELVRIYAGDALNFAVDNDVLERYEAVRPMMRDVLVGLGYRPGFSNGEVDFFNLGFDADDPSDPLGQGAFDFAVGFSPESDTDRRFGPSLVVMARVLPPGVAFTSTEASYANEDLADLSHASVLGYVSGPSAGPAGSTLTGIIPHLALSEWSKLPPISFTNTIVNAVIHIASSAQMFRREVLHIEWPPASDQQDNERS